MSNAPVASELDAAPATDTTVPVRFSQTDSFVALLHQLGSTLLVTTYQAGQLLALRADGNGVSMLVRTFDKPMGMAVEGRRLALGTRDRIWLFRDAPDLAQQLEPPGRHDACYLPRTCFVTGDIAVHELAWAFSGVRGQESGVRNQAEHDQLTADSCLVTHGRGEIDLWVVNTRFSCLCVPHADYSFVPRWRPPFVSALAGEDRCHLNGLAMAADERGVSTPRYVTALGETDTADGWRPGKVTDGCLLDVASGNVVVRGLCMPHSPRLHDGRLWLLESGTGRLLLVDPAAGRGQPVAQLPGYTRGLALAGPYAFIGLSKIRETSTFGGLPIAQRREQLQCGVAVVDLRSGQLVAGLEFQTAIEEIFDVQLLPGVRFPEVVGFQREAVRHMFVVPPV